MRQRHGGLVLDPFLLRAQMNKVDRYLLRGSRTVAGWMFSGAAAMVRAISDAQREPGNIAEIGVYHGMLFILLYLLARGDGRY